MDNTGLLLMAMFGKQAKPSKKVYTHKFSMPKTAKPFLRVKSVRIDSDGLKAKVELIPVKILTKKDL